jgi:hypothetical protein
MSANLVDFAIGPMIQAVDAEEQTPGNFMTKPTKNGSGVTIGCFHLCETINQSS